MAKKLLITVILTTLILILIITPMVLSGSVTETSLTINTEPNHEVAFKATDAENGNVVQPLTTKNSRDSGTITFTVSSFAVKEINLEIAISKDYTEVSRETFGPYPVISPITIDIDLTEEKTAEMTTEETETETTTETTKQKTSGQAVTEGNETGGGFSLKTLWYIAIIIVVGGGIFFGVRFFMQRVSIPKNIVVKKQSDLLKEQKEAMKEVKEIGGKKLDELERKMKEIQAEIYKIKNEDKIRLAEEKVREEMERLERLRRGEE